MDPNETLREMRELQAELDSPATVPPALDQLLRLAELAQALDEWITGGGFLPGAWHRQSTQELFDARQTAKRAGNHEEAERLRGVITAERERALKP